MKIPVYIGFDQVEAGAFWTCASSILENTTVPVEIIPLKRTALPLTRPKHPRQSNEFAFTRFLVPYLQNYSGYGIFVDCDFLFFGNISDLWFLRDESKAVQVCKHSGETFVDGTKYLGTGQYKYDKKCWSSLMIFNCAHPDCGILTPEYIDSADGLDLHQFKWTDEESIGELPLEWNWLVDHYNPKKDIKAAHFTEGGPYFKEYSNCDYHLEWWEAFNKMKYVKEGVT